MIKNVLFARFRIPYSSQGHSEGSKVNLGGLRGHLLHTETFLVVFCRGGGCLYLFFKNIVQG